MDEAAPRASQRCIWGIHARTFGTYAANGDWDSADAERYSQPAPHGATRAPPCWSLNRECSTRAGWGARLLEKRGVDGRWAGGLYTPKWTSTFYTLQLLSLLGVGEEQAEAAASCRLLLEAGVQADGAVKLWAAKYVDTCVTGMLSAIAIRFGQRSDARVTRMLDWLRREQMTDGGWNCRSHRGGATHAAFHTTTSVLEALQEWSSARRKPDVELVRGAAAGREFLLAHRLYRSHRTGAVVRSDFTRFAFPHWWKFDVLRGLDHFRVADVWDPRLLDPVRLVASKRGKDGRWMLPAAHPGNTWFALEKPGQASRWNTLRALRVLRWAESASRAA
jgi:hypothetical protein